MHLTWWAICLYLLLLGKHLKHADTYPLMSKSDPFKKFILLWLCCNHYYYVGIDVFQQHKCNKCIQTLNELALVKYENSSSEMSDDPDTSAFYLLPKETTDSFFQSLKEIPYWIRSKAMLTSALLILNSILHCQYF